MKIFCILLSLILVFAKICGLITLGWLACLAPVLIYIAVFIIVFVIMLIFAVFVDEKD